MKVKALIDFHDLQAKEDRAKGKHFECDDERGKHLIAIGYVEECKERPVERRTAAPKPVEDED